MVDIFSPMSWTLSSQDTPDDIPDSIENGVYSLIPTTGCHVKCTTDEQVDTVWFTTPVSQDLRHSLLITETDPRVLSRF